MFSFLSPWYLWALPAAATPVLLHFLFLRRARRVPFGDLTLLRAAYLRARPSSRLRQWLLLAARCLILASLILVFARPVMHSSAAGASGAAPEESVHVVFLADVSASMGYQMGGKTRLDLAKDYGARILKFLKPQDKIAVAAFSDHVEGTGGLEWAADPAQARAELERLEVGPRPTNFAPSLEAAYRFLKASPAKRKVIVLLSDNAAHGWRGSSPGESSPGRPEELPDFDPSVILAALRWQDVPDNAAILGVEPGPDDGTSPSLTVRIGLQGAPRSSWDLGLWQGDRRTDQKQVRLDPGELSTSFHFPPGQDPSAWGRVELRHDALSSDDAYYYSFWTQTRPKILLVQGGPRSMEVGRGGYFLKKLFLDPQGSLLPYDLEVADSVRVKTLALSVFQTVILIDFRGIPPDLGAALGRYVEGGGGLWVIAGKTEGSAAYGPLDRVLPARIGEVSGLGAESGLEPEPGAFSDPSGTRFSWKEFELQKVRISRAAALEPRPDARIWLRDAAGRPLWVWGRYGEGKVLVWGSALDFTWTDLALKPVFAAFMDFGLSRLTGYSRRREWRTVKVGDPIVRVWGAEAAAPASVLLRVPGGRAVRLQVEGRRAQYVADGPGLYFLEGASPTEEVFAANLDRDTREWDLRSGLPGQFRYLRPEALEADFLRTLYGTEARNSLLALALLLIIAETWLANRPIHLGPSREGPSLPETARVAVSAAVCLLIAARPAAAQAGGAPPQDSVGDKFVWTQLRYDGIWDPYPEVPSDILKFVGSATSILSMPERRMLTLRDPALFESPFVVLAGRSAPPQLEDSELEALRGYLTSGGFLWIEDTSGLQTSPFDYWVRRTLKSVFPDSDLTPLGADHVIYKTFFLMRSVGGRAAVSGSLEGIDWGGRTVVVYSRNDVLGAWAKDAFGRYLFECAPGGEVQRMNARKLALNIIMYSLTGSYKSDAVHQPYLLQKMRLGLSP